MADSALVRARHMKSRLEEIRKLPPRDAERVLARVPAESQQRIADAASIEWLDMRIDLEVTNAIRAGLGEAAFHRFFREAQAEAFSGPLLRVMVDAALRVFRMDAAAFTGWLGRGWSLVFRNCGSWRTEGVGADEARVRILGLPPECASDEVWLASVADSIAAFFLVARTPGECLLAASDPAQGTASYHLSWR